MSILKTAFSHKIVQWGFVFKLKNSEGFCITQLTFTDKTIQQAAKCYT